MNYDQMAQQSYQQNQATQAQDNANVSKYTNAYDTASQQANQAQGDLSNFTKNMKSGTDFYQTGVQQGNANSGYDVNNLNQAQNQVSQLTSILGNLPRSVQGENANYGATAGQVAGQLSTEGTGLSNSLALANQNSANQIQKQQAGLTYGQQYAGAGLQGQQSQLTGYTAAANNAVNIMQQAQQAMQSWAKIAQDQGGLTASQQASYASAKQAAASAAQAYAQIGLINAQSATEQYKLQNTKATDAAAQATASANPTNLPTYQNADGSTSYGPSKAQLEANRTRQAPLVGGAGSSQNAEYRNQFAQNLAGFGNFAGNVGMDILHFL